MLKKKLLNCFTVLAIPKTLNQNVVVGQNGDPRDISSRIAIKEKYERIINITNNLRETNEMLDTIISELKMKRISLETETCKLSNFLTAQNK